MTEYRLPPLKPHKSYFLGLFSCNVYLSDGTKTSYTQRAHSYKHMFKLAKAWSKGKFGEEGRVAAVCRMRQYVDKEEWEHDVKTMYY